MRRSIGDSELASLAALIQKTRTPRAPQFSRTRPSVPGLPVTGPHVDFWGVVQRLVAACGTAGPQAFWSGRWESNPRPKLGKLLYCHCTTPAQIAFILSKVGPRGQRPACAILRQGTPGALQRHWIPIPPRIADVGPGVWSGRFPWFERNFEGLDGELLRA